MMDTDDGHSSARNMLSRQLLMMDTDDGHSAQNMLSL